MALWKRSVKLFVKLFMLITGGSRMRIKIKN